ncbi:3-hydroxybutyrate dehydrogenase [Roseomonas sp. BN140053]|uniref:3-hydroxybutyrate dehydrogenase n=1 Tax=Roseomonas sp. BN140053 TaxID=3391898 RepID=UPI0039EBCEE6
MTVRPLAGRCALITGSTSGIGLAVAEALGAQGADLMLNGLVDDRSAETLCRSLGERHGVRVAHHGADVSHPGEVEALIDAAQRHAGGLDILVNNAGISHVAPLEAFPAERWDALLSVHLSAAFHTMRLALPGLQQRGWGRIVNIASVFGLIATQHQAAYVAAKHGLVGLTKVVALETARSPVTCNAVCPGLVSTPRVLRDVQSRADELGIPLEEAKRMTMSTRQPAGEYIAAADVAAVVAFLCSPQAAEVRGVAWAIDGGWTAR